MRSSMICKGDVVFLVGEPERMLVALSDEAEESVRLRDLDGYDCGRSVLLCDVVEPAEALRILWDRGERDMVLSRLWQLPLPDAIAFCVLLQPGEVQWVVDRMRRRRTFASA